MLPLWKTKICNIPYDFLACIKWLSLGCIMLENFTLKFANLGCWVELIFLNYSLDLGLQLGQNFYFWEDSQHTSALQYYILVKICVPSIDDHETKHPSTLKNVEDAPCPAAPSVQTRFNSLCEHKQAHPSSYVSLLSSLINVKITCVP